jgi:hypothetical protein
MTTPNYSGAVHPGPVEPTGAKEQAKQAASTAAEEGKHVAGVAKDQAQQVASQAQQQTKNLMGEARSQLEDQSRTQRDRLVSRLRTLSDDIEKMASGEGADAGMAQDLARQVAQRARELSSRVEGREPAELLEEVRGFARRRPGTFLLGALAAGIVAGRLTRGAREASSSEPRSGGASVPGTYPAAGAVTTSVPGADMSGVSPAETLPPTPAAPGTTSGTVTGTPPGHPGTTDPTRGGAV